MVCNEKAPLTLPQKIPAEPTQTATNEWLWCRVGGMLNCRGGCDYYTQSVCVYAYKRRTKVWLWGLTIAEHHNPEAGRAASEMFSSFFVPVKRPACDPSFLTAAQAVWLCLCITSTVKWWLTSECVGSADGCFFRLFILPLINSEGLPFCEYKKIKKYKLICIIRELWNIFCVKSQVFFFKTPTQLVNYTYNHFY